jgi:aspartyl-tRNA(Asn)/glutamyl-tRNA(Gln) amidotransferase subunit A
MMELPRSITAFAESLRRGEFSALEVGEEVLDRAGSSQSTLNAFITFTRSQAQAQAKRVDDLLAKGTDLGPMMGVPIAVKDVFDVAGVPTTAGSRLLAQNVPTSTAQAVERLVAAGAVLIGKTNMDQFAFGPHQEDFGRTNCPADVSRYAGGSSGGSAAAVAAGLVLASLGSDAGGSTRFPAACCGVVGMKPTFGRVPTQGMYPSFWTVDHVGVIAGSAADTSIVLGVIADAKLAAGSPPVAPRLAVFRDWATGCSEAVRTAVGDAIEALVAAGAVVDEADLPRLDDTIQTLIRIVVPEASVALERWLSADPAAFPTAILEMLAPAASQLATDYVLAQRDRERWRAHLDRVLERADIVILPTSLDVAWSWADIDSSSMGVRDRSTVYLPLANLTGHPAISLPVPGVQLPVGLQLIGSRGSDERLLALSGWIEGLLAARLGDTAV